MKIVIDSNVIISAFAARGLCNEVFQLCLMEHNIFICDIIIEEIRRGLLKKIKVPASIVEDIIKFIKDRTIKVKPVTLDKEICRDPKDLMLLGTAISSSASDRPTREVILTGDKDLLIIKKYKDIKILAPKQLWELLKKETQ